MNRTKRIVAAILAIAMCAVLFAGCSTKPGGDGCALIFKKGKIIKKVPESEVLDSLMEEIDKL